MVRQLEWLSTRAGTPRHESLLACGSSVPTLVGAVDIIGDARELARKVRARRYTVHLCGAKTRPRFGSEPKVEPGPKLVEPGLVWATGASRAVLRIILWPDTRALIQS